MKIKKFILAVFIVLSLSFSFQPVNIYAKEKELIIYVVDRESDNFTSEFIKKNETKRVYTLVSLTLNVMISSTEGTAFNTS